MPSPAGAHFVLQTPANWMSQDSFGAPIKLGPCGDEGGGTPTGTVTAFQSGTMVTITIDETIYHPGHYRVALSTTDRSQLPAEPTVTPGAGTPCGTVPIMSPAVFPVLADGVLVHTAAFSGPQTFQVKLPDGMTCDHCTLQVIEFMSEHPLNMPGGCFYHHCADIKIQSTPVIVDGGAGDGGSGTGSGSSGCGYSAPSGRSALSVLLGLAMIAAALYARRRRA
jgi:hypothetical protein